MASSPTKSAFDLTHGTDTDGTLRLSEFSVDFENVRYGMSYQPTNPQAIADAMAHFGEMPQDFTLVDMGSGKGRILIGAVEQGFRHVFGVEFVRELNEVARENISVRGIHNATLWTGDAAQYVFPPGNLLIYFGNPFRVEVMRAVIENLRTADYEKLYVVYRVPRCSAALDGCGFLTALGELPGWEGEYGVKTWRGDRV